MPLPSELSFAADNKCPAFDAASAAYISYKPKVFEQRVMEFDKIRAAVANKFGISSHQVMSCGSAHFGFSCFKKTDFVPASSDLDLAIISPSLYSRLFDAALTVTNGFMDNTKFDDQTAFQSFKVYLSQKGMIRPDLMPRCSDKTLWFAFFKHLSGNHKAAFKSINAAVYLSEKSFVFKQIPSILALRGEV